MKTTIGYGRVPNTQCLGRNRFFSTEGLSVYTDVHGDIHLNPITTKGKVSKACRIVIPVEAIPDVMAGLVSHIRSPEQPRRIPAAARLARLVARLTGRPQDVALSETDAARARLAI
jgi:hypothetical protein